MNRYLAATELNGRRPHNFKILREIYVSRFIVKNRREQKLKWRLNTFLHEIYESEYHSRFDPIKHIVEDLLCDYVCENNEFVEAFCEHLTDTIDTEFTQRRICLFEIPEGYHLLKALLDKKDPSHFRTILYFDL